MTEFSISVIAAVLAGSLVAGYRRRDSRIAQRLAAIAGPALGDVASPLGRRRGLLHRLGQALPLDVSSMQSKLEAAGLTTEATKSYAGARLLLAALGVLLGLQMGSFAVLAAPLGAAAGWHLPMLYLKARIKLRTDEINRELPDVADLLAVCTRAGLNLQLSMQRVSMGSHGLLTQEVARVVSETDLGLPRREALEGLARRIDSHDVDSFVTTLVTSERFGTRVAASLEDFASDLRSKRRRAAEERARRAPVKMLFPLAFLILPAFILLTVVPLLLGTFQSLGF